MKFQTLVNEMAIDTANNLHKEFGVVSLKKLTALCEMFFEANDIPEPVRKRAMFEACNVHGVLIQEVQ